MQRSVEPTGYELFDNLILRAPNRTCALSEGRPLRRSRRTHLERLRGWPRSGNRCGVPGMSPPLKGARAYLDAVASVVQEEGLCVDPSTWPEHLQSARLALDEQMSLLSCVTRFPSWSM